LEIQDAVAAALALSVSGRVIAEGEIQPREAFRTEW
jgi:hypothetical protein